MGGVTMKIWRYLPVMLVIIICMGSMAVSAEFTLASGGTGPAGIAGNISLSAPQAGATGLSIMSTTTDPDTYSLTTSLDLGSIPYGVTSDTCGGSGVQVTSGALNQVRPRVSEKYLAFEQWNSGSSAVGVYDLTKGSLSVLSSGGYQQTHPEVSGRLVVYQQETNQDKTILNVYGYDTQTQTSLQVTPSTANQIQPAVSGKFMVWQDWSQGNANIALADLNTGSAKLICQDLGVQEKPAISGGYVVWEDWRNGNADIYLYDITEGKEYQLTSNKYDQKNPRISGNIVVWDDNRNGESDIYALNLQTLKETRLTSGAYKCVNPDVSGPLVTWEAYPSGSSGYAQIMLLDLISGRIYQLTRDQYDHKNPSIYGNRVAWEDYRSGNSNICLYTIPKSGSGQTTGKYLFYGLANSCGSAAPAGSVVSAVISGTSASRGSLTLTQNGMYGSQYGPYLEVPVYSDDVGKTITFYIDDKPADQTMVIGTAGTYKLDLSASCASPVNSYLLSGQVLLDNQYAQTGTVVSALVGGNVRSQVSVTQAGQYSGLKIPVYSSDSGKYLTFSAVYNGVTYTTSQQIWVGSSGSGTGGSGSGSGGITLMSVDAAQAGTASTEGYVSQKLDLSFTSSSSQTRYLFNGAVRIGSQYATAGTLITAMVNNNVRGQVSVSSAGQYSGLSVPIYSTDSGKPITFTATQNGITYTTSQQVWIGSAGSGSSGSGDVVVMSADSASFSVEGIISRQLDLTFSTSSTSGKYQLYGTAIIDGSSLPAGRIIYATVDGQIRGQITVTSAGQYGSQYGPYLEVPIYQGDIGKSILFQTDSGAAADQSQLIVSGMVLLKNLNFASKSSATADFVASPVQGMAPLTVKFTDKSTGSPRSYSWDFGDGKTSSEYNPTHTYTRDGVYSVGLVAGYWNGVTKTVVKQNYISVGVTTPPSAQIGLNPGWNFISTPKMLASGVNTAKVLFGNIDVGGHSIFSYNPRSKSWNVVGSSTVINPLEALWVYSVRKDTINLYFTGDALQIPQTKKLIKGWNTFGVTSLNSVSAYNTLLSIKDKWVYVIGYDSASQRFQNTIMNVPDSSQGALYPGYGYWIYMSDEGDLAAVGL
jgi:beta propeller repeat protein